MSEILSYVVEEDRSKKPKGVYWEGPDYDYSDINNWRKMHGLPLKRKRKLESTIVISTGTSAIGFAAGKEFITQKKKRGRQTTEVTYVLTDKGLKKLNDHLKEEEHHEKED